MGYLNLEEEIEALKSIYGESSFVEGVRKSPLQGILFQNEERTLKLYNEYFDGISEIKIVVPSGYPKDNSSYSIRSWYFDINHIILNDESSISKNIALNSNIIEQLKELIEMRTGKKEPILFEMIDHLIFYYKQNMNKIEDHTEVKSRKDFKECTDNRENVEFNEDKVFGIIHGEPIVDRKSVFQAHVCRVNNIEEVHKIIKYLLSNPKIAKATHNMWSYRLCKDKKINRKEGSFPIGYDVITQDHDSDGETAAGGRLQHLLNIVDAKNVFVMVTRWYGGIQLGSDRFRHINNAARQTLEKSGLISSKNSSVKICTSSKKQKT